MQSECPLGQNGLRDAFDIACRDQRSSWPLWGNHLGSMWESPASDTTTRTGISLTVRGLLLDGVNQLHPLNMTVQTAAVGSSGSRIVLLTDTPVKRQELHGYQGLTVGSFINMKPQCCKGLRHLPPARPLGRPRGEGQAEPRRRLRRDRWAGSAAIQAHNLRA